MSKIRVVRLPAMYRNPDAAPEAIAVGMRNGLAAAGRMGVSEVRQRIMDSQPRPPRDTGLMSQSIGAEVAGDGRSVLIGPSPATLARTAVMEEGRRPGGRMPPVDALARWALRKGLVAGFVRQGRRRRAKDEGKRARSIAFAVARSIVKKGIKARRFFKRATPAIRGRAPQLVQQGIAMAMATVRRANPFDGNWHTFGRAR